MAIGVGDIFRVAMRQSYGVDDVVNVMHFHCDAIPGMGGDALLVEDVSTFMGDLWNNIANMISGSQEAVDINVYNVTDDAPAGVGDFGDYAGGTATGEALPASNAALCLLPTGKKRTIGRIYLGVFTEGYQANGRWSAEAIGNIEGFLETLQAPVVGANGYEFTYGVYSRGDGILRYPVSSRVVPVVAIQRRRKPGVGS